MEEESISWASKKVAGASEQRKRASTAADRGQAAIDDAQAAANMAQEAVQEAEKAVSRAQKVLYEWKEKHPDYNGDEIALNERSSALTREDERRKEAYERFDKAKVELKESKQLIEQQRIRTKDVAFDIAIQGPVPSHSFIVPMETIQAYEELLHLFKESRLSTTLTSRPLCLLYGPRQFGKTTIAYRLFNKLEQLPSVCAVFLRLSVDIIRTESSFWTTVGLLIKQEINNSFDLETYLSRSEQKLCIFIDELDLMFENANLTTAFIGIISRWQSANYFFGFLGIGSYDLLNLHKRHKGSDRVSPFNLPHRFNVKPFSAQQMSHFFELISPYYNFALSTREAIRQYCSGAPGVFGSLIRFSIDKKKWKCEGDEWNTWFKLDKFPTYLTQYNQTYSRIREDFQTLTDSDWKALTYLLIHEEIAPNKLPDFELEKLMRMGIVMDVDDSVEFSSKVMERICMEAQPVREISQLSSQLDGPIDLLSASLQLIKPDVIKHALVSNRQSPSEAVFQFELYASLRSIFIESRDSRKVLAEVRGHGDKKRLDIAISNGGLYGFELKSNKLTMEDIQAAIKQANGYKKFLKINKMFVVNFVPVAPRLDEVYQCNEFEDIQVIHVRFPESCDEYELKFCGKNGETVSRKVAVSVGRK